MLKEGLGNAHVATWYFITRNMWDAYRYFRKGKGESGKWGAMAKAWSRGGISARATGCKVTVGGVGWGMYGVLKLMLTSASEISTQIYHLQNTKARWQHIPSCLCLREWSATCSGWLCCVPSPLHLVSRLEAGWAETLGHCSLMEIPGSNIIWIQYPRIRVDATLEYIRMSV